MRQNIAFILSMVVVISMATVMLFIVIYENIAIIWFTLLITSLLLLITNPPPNNESEADNKKNSPFSKLTHHYATKIFNGVRAINTIFSKANDYIVYTPRIKSQPDYPDNHSLIHTDNVSQENKAVNQKGTLPDLGTDGTLGTVPGTRNFDNDEQQER